MQALFKSPCWLLLDRGIITDEQALAEFYHERPALSPYLQKAWEEWHEMLTPIPETAAFIAELDQAGHPLYFLSNLHKRTCDYILAQYPALWSHFDGGVFSCDTGYIKPEIQLFQTLLDKYHLRPADCIYIDDHPENVRAANSLGMAGVVFTCPRDLEQIKELTGK